MKLKIKLFLTALPYLAVARADIGIVPRPLSAAEGRGTFAITERTVVASPETLRQEKIRFRNRAVTYRSPCFVPADRERHREPSETVPLHKRTNCDTEDMNPHLLAKTACRTSGANSPHEPLPSRFISYLWR